MRLFGKKNSVSIGFLNVMQVFKDLVLSRYVHNSSCCFFLEYIAIIWEGKGLCKLFSCIPTLRIKKSF